ncbi:MAG TPA: FG-GAP-like repeat-containing protein [Candidatus Sulfotelmatobacter sp.]|nr:FG-GAP-like repeat-containing protein [Candidatus Sulfotelmatobacter sp.]
MNPKISAALIGTLLAAVSLLAPQSKPNPTESARLNNLGCAYMNQQLFEKALKSFQQAVALDPKLVIARLNEGVAYLNLQKLGEAKSALERALKDDPNNPYAWYNLGLLAKNSGGAQTAIDDFTHVTQIDPQDADTWYFLGASYAQAKQFPQAIDAFHHALDINPLHASAEFGLSRAYQQSGDVDHAREQLKKFQHITETKIGVPMSLAYGEQGQYSRAVESPLSQLKPPPQIKVQFVDVTKEAGLPSKPTSVTSDVLAEGACFLDYDNDGKIDLFLPSGSPSGGMALYHNLGGGKFKDVSVDAGFDLSQSAESCTTGDYDNDGFVDLAVVVDGRVNLWHNEKGRAFKDVTGASGIKSSPDERAHSLVFIDYDHDGDLDVFALQRDRCKAPVGVFDACFPGRSMSKMWRNNGNGIFTDVTKQTELMGELPAWNAVGTDFNNDRAVDLAVTGPAAFYENPREGKFVQRRFPGMRLADGIAILDFDHDGWMDVALSWARENALTLWRNNHGKSFDQVKLPETNWVRAYGVAAFDYDNDGWVDLVAVGETKEGKGEIKLFRNLGPDGFKDVTADVGLDKIHLESPRAIITGDYDNDGAVDLLITQNHGPAVLLRNVVLPNPGGNQNHWLRLALKGLTDNKSAIGTKVEVFAGGNRQKFEIYGSNGYLGQNSPYLTVGLGQSTEADIVRMLWPTGVLQDEINLAADKQHDILELDRRGSSCPTLFAWNGERYQFVADMLGAGVVGHWVGPGQRDIPRPVEYIKIPRELIREKEYSQVSQNQGDLGNPTEVHTRGGAPLLAGFARSGNSTTGDQESTMLLSFRFMEPLEEAVYLDQVRLLAVDHPADVDVYPNEYFASNPPYPEFKVVVSKDAKPPAGAWDEHGHNVLPDLLAHRFIGNFAVTRFLGFAEPHTLTLDLGEPYDGGPLWLLLHGEVEYFSANSMYAASQAGLQAFAPYVEALDNAGKWKHVLDDMGFPAGGARTMTADLTGKLPVGTRQIRFTTNLQIYWDSILIDRTPQATAREILRRAGENARLQDDVDRNAGDITGVGSHPERSRTSGGAKDLARIRTDKYRMEEVPLISADLEFHGYPLKIEGKPAGNVNYIYEKASATGPYTRPAGTYTRYGDVLPLLTATDDKLVVFGSGDEVRLDFDPSNLPPPPKGWVRDFFFAANGYEKDMDFYAAEGNYVAPLPFLSMGDYPYSKPRAFPLDEEHVNYLLEYNTRHMSGKEQRGYWFDYGPK